MNKRAYSNSAVVIGCVGVLLAPIGCARKPPISARGSGAQIGEYRLAGQLAEAQPGHTPMTEPGSPKRLKLYPVDEGARDPSFASFREKLLEAAKKRDMEFVLSIVDPRIQNSFGGDGGVNEFKQYWKIEQPGSELWDELAAILSLGGSFTKSEAGLEFCAPYVYSTWSSIQNHVSEADGIPRHAAIVRENVELRREPKESAVVLGLLSYDVVKVDYEHSIPDGERRERFAWVKVLTRNGKEGYVAGRNVRSPLDHRACFRQQNETWRITALVAGD